MAGWHMGCITFLLMKEANASKNLEELPPVLSSDAELQFQVSPTPSLPHSHTVIPTFKHSDYLWLTCWHSPSHPITHSVSHLSNCFIYFDIVMKLTCILILSTDSFLVNRNDRTSYLEITYLSPCWGVSWLLNAQFYHKGMTK